MNPVYFYESHTGGLYTLDCELDAEYLYCNECGDYDQYIGCADDYVDAISMLVLNNMVDIEGSGGYDLEYVHNIVCEAYKMKITP